MEINRILTGNQLNKISHCKGAHSIQLSDFAISISENENKCLIGKWNSGSSLLEKKVSIEEMENSKLRENTYLKKSSPYCKYCTVNKQWLLLLSFLQCDSVPLQTNHLILIVHTLQISNIYERQTLQMRFELFIHFFPH